MIEVFVCDDMDYIRSVMFDDEMFERASDDFMVKNDDLLRKGVWLKITDSGTNYGLSAVRPVSSSVVNVHIHIPQKNRGEKTVQAGKAVLNWIVNNSKSNFSKINTQIPIIYRDVIIYALKLGFKKEGVNRYSVLKKGSWVDQQYMGITFEEVGACPV